MIVFFVDNELKEIESFDYQKNEVICTDGDIYTYEQGFFLQVVCIDNKPEIKLIENLNEEYKQEIKNDKIRKYSYLPTKVRIN